VPKTDGYKTKAKILRVAEKLFAEKGYNGTSIDRIAKTAGVNKGLIYYHFKDKKDIFVSIMQNIINEIEQSVHLSVQKEVAEVDDLQLQQKIKAEIEFCRQRKKIILVMMMEALKVDGDADFLFKCAEMVIQQEMDGIRKKMPKADPLNSQDRTRYLLHEFFTGFVPIITFVSLQDKWCKYFDCDRSKALEYFIESFTQTHIKGNLM
jgi:AcrR family transcriptional regulator